MSWNAKSIGIIMKGIKKADPIKEPDKPIKKVKSEPKADETQADQKK